MTKTISNLIRLITVLGVIGVALGLTNGADDPAAAARATLERIESLRKERPNDGVLAFYEALVRVGFGEREPAFELLRTLKGRNLGIIPVRDTGFERVWNDPEFQKIQKELAGEELRTPDSPVAFRLNDPRLIPEGIAYDGEANRFFIGSIAQRKIVVTGTKGEASDFSNPSDKLDTILGLTVDAARGQLYAVSTNGFEDSAKTERRNFVVSYNLKTRRIADRFAAAEAMQLNDVAVAPDGTIYATDSASGTLFRRKANEKALSRFGETGALRGANGITFAPDGTLYVTLSTGIARVSTTTGEPTRLSQPDNVVTGGIDGVYWHDGDLLGIQNTTNPGRVIRIGLADKGERISGITVLQSSHHPDFDEPTTGAIANGALNVIGNSYVGHYQPDSTIKDKEELKGTAIVAVPLRR